MLHYIYNKFYIVPLPVVNVTALNNQTVGQSLTLQCEVTTVRGITSRVDIVWSDGDTVLNMSNDTTATTVDNSLVYTDSYTISLLNTSDNNRVIDCEVVIDVDPIVMSNGSIMLDVIGEYYSCNFFLLLVFHHSPYFSNYNIPTWSNTRFYGRKPFVSELLS